MNPFVYHAPVRGTDFFNREETIWKIINQLFSKAQGNIWLTGERQVGKTSLLQHLENNSDKYIRSFHPYCIEKTLKPVFIYVNTQDIQNDADFYSLLHYGIKSKFDIKNKQENNKYEAFINILINRFENGFYPVFLIDEFDSMLESIAQIHTKNFSDFIKKFNATLESIQKISSKPKAFACIFSANCTMNELLSHLELKGTIGSGLRFEGIEFKWFSKKQVAELASSYLKNDSIQFTKKEIDFCYKYTQGYPYFTQKVFSMMYEHKPKYSKENDFLKAIKSEVKKEFEDTIKAWGASKMPPHTFNKLKILAEKVGDKLFDFGLNILEAYLKGEIKIQ